MKKFLSVLLAVIMVFSTIVMAAPSAVTGFDTAKENTEDSAQAELAATADIYNIRYFAIGNSYLTYDYSTSAPHVKWWMDYNGNTGSRGMAASAPEKDYFRQIQKGIKEDIGINATVTADLISAAAAEPSWIQGLTDSTDYKSFNKANGETALTNAYKSIMDKITAFKPNVITLQVGENTGLSASWNCPAEWYYTYLLEMIRQTAPDAIIVLVGTFDKDSVVHKGQTAAYNKLKENDAKLYFADNSNALGYAWNETKTYNNPLGGLGVADYQYNSEYLAYLSYPEYDNVMLNNPDEVDFRAHPGDEGMKFIADNAVAQLKTAIVTNSNITPEEITIPDSFEIYPLVNDSTTDANDCYKESNGTIYLSTVYEENEAANLADKNVRIPGTARFLVNKVSPSDANTDLVWSVDKEEIAEIYAYDGFARLIAKRNGNVTVTAASKYNSQIKATFELNIRQQLPHYTLTYAAGTNDTSVANIPAAYEYAAGDYTFPAAATVPTRNGYKFAGWSETVGGKAVASVYMDKAKTVYAVWEFADNWQFNTPGNDEGISYGGMHGKVVVEDGVGYATATTYNSGAASIKAENLLIPADTYKTFNTRLSLSTVNSGDKVVLEIVTTDGTKTFEAPITKANTFLDFTFDISSVTGTITSFKVGSSNADISTNVIKVDHAAFVKSYLSGNQTYDNRTVSGIEVFESGNNKYTFTNLTIEEGATLQLGSGNYEIGTLNNSGNIVASPNANVVIAGDYKPAGYIEINIGTKTNTVRYAEVDGYEHKISEAAANTKYGMILAGDADKLLQIEDGTNTKYYLVDASAKTCKELTGLADYMTTDKDTHPLGNNYGGGSAYGATYAASVNKANKTEYKEYSITEYGYIVSVDELLGTQQLNFDADSSKYAYGAAYEKGVSDKVFSATDTIDTFKAVIYGENLKPNAYNKKLVVKTYTKLAILEKAADGSGYETVNEFTVYGPAEYESFYSLAKKLENDAVAQQLIKAADDASKDAYLDYGDLWK